MVVAVVLEEEEKEVGEEENKENNPEQHKNEEIWKAEEIYYEEPWRCATKDWRKIGGGGEINKLT